MFGSPETTSGGRALKFAASVRIDIRRVTSITEGDRAIGNRTRVKIVKNKVAAPFGKAEFDIMYNEGISYVGDVLDLPLSIKSSLNQAHGSRMVTNVLARVAKR